MSEENKLHKIAKKTYNNPITQATLTAIDTLPVIGAFTASSRKAMEQAYANAVEDRRRAFLDELEKGGVITSEMLDTEEFIHSVFVTYSAAMRTFQREKIRRFARILLSAIEKNELASDKFEEYVQILESLSERELFILNSLYPLESKLGVDNSGTETNSKNLKQARIVLEELLDEKNILASEELSSILYRLSGTGLYILVQGMLFGYSGGLGITSPAFRDFSEWIKLESEKLSADG